MLFKLSFPSQHTNELKIITLLKAKDVKGIHLLYDQYANLLFGLIHRIVEEEEIAESVLEATFLQAWNQIEDYSSEHGRFSSWLLRIGRTLAIEFVESTPQKRAIKLFNRSIPSVSTSKAERSKNKSSKIEATLSCMDQDSKTLIELIYLKGLGLPELAKKMNQPPEIIKLRVRSAFKELRLLLNR